MNLPDFTHFAPATLQDASALLLRYREQARVLAGGTDILVKMKHRRAVPRYLVNIKKIPGLDYIRYDEGEGLRIGALTAIETIKGSAVVRKKYPILHDAASCVGTVEIRNCGTLAGNICNASPAAETVPGLILLGARLRVVKTNAQRIVPLEEFFLGPGRTVLEHGELVAEILISDPAPETGGAYDKFSLRRMDLAVVAAAAMLRVEDGLARGVKIMLGSVAPTAMRAKDAETLLEGRAPGEELIEEAGRAAAGESRPIADLFGTVEQKRNMVAVLTSRVLRHALDRARKRGG